MTDRINEVRKVLDLIWQKSQAVGRCWQKKNGGNNPLATSHITFVGEEEAVTVFYHGVQLCLIEYKAVANTSLGNEIRKTLEEKGIKINNF